MRQHDGVNVTDYCGRALLAEDVIELVNERARELGPITGIIRQDGELFLCHESGVETRVFGFVEVWDVRPSPPWATKPVVIWETEPATHSCSASFTNGLTA